MANPKKDSLRASIVDSLPPETHEMLMLEDAPATARTHPLRMGLESI